MIDFTMRNIETESPLPPPTGTPPSLLCPVDRAALAVAAWNDHAIHRCPQCLGVAVPGTLLREVRAFAALEMHKQQGVSAAALACPVDGQTTKALSYKGVALCACPQCYGLWLDAEQLTRLLALVAPPTVPDLSRIGQNLGTLRDGRSSFDIDSVLDVFDIGDSVLDGLNLPST